MKESEADQIANLLNTQNQLTVQYDAKKVMKHQGDLLFHCDDNGTVTCAAEVVKVQCMKGDVVPIFPLKLGSWYDRFARMPRGPRLDMEVHGVRLN